ncbi:MAG: RsmB/NOP family class I SAM-dependent RNA methyltransferase [Pseudomonadota bacterium]|nr:RsmB/NOP family class I SAM-dependent RNA methyltransferase [Pseudomonadota bacterium]
MSVQLSPFRLEATELALSNILSLHEPVDLSLHKLFRSLPKLGVQDRFFVAENCYTILRFLRRLEWICQDNITPRRIFLANLLYYQGFSIREISSHIHSKETKWLEYSRNLTLPATNPALTLNLPDWLYIKLSQIFEPEELTQLAYSLNSPASLDLRVNSLLGRRPEILSRLQNKNIASALTPYAPLGLRLDNKMDLVHLDLFKEGIIEVQDEGSQLICQLMEAKRHERIADFCAGAGGKSLALSADMKSSGQIYAFDISEKRLAKMRPRLRRSTSTNIQPIRIESEHDPKLERYQARMDRVLVDAPCSGLGTLRRNPELKWRQSPDTIA